MTDDIVADLTSEWACYCEYDDCVHSLAAAEIKRLQALVDDYENSICWDTTCTNCAKLLDDNYDQYCEIERLRAERDDHKARLAVEAVTAPDADYDAMVDSLQARIRDMWADTERMRALIGNKPMRFMIRQQKAGGLQ
jgi:hypothetical protein